MNRLNFNPDEFVFEKLPVPEDKKAVIEYDSRQRIILVRTKDYNGDIVFNSVFVSEQVNQNILDGLPDTWHNENDKITIFALYDDGEYFIEKEKVKYDFKTNTTKWVKYRSKDLTVNDVREFAEVLKTAITIDEQVSEYEALKDMLEVTRTSFYLEAAYQNRMTVLEKLLRDSDWRVLDDTPELYDGEKDQWILWRQKIRELDKSPEDFESGTDFLIWQETLEFPIRPDQYRFKYPEFNVEYLSTDDQYTKSPDVLVNKSGFELLQECTRYEAIIKSYEDTGLVLNEAMIALAKRYKLAKDIVTNANISHLFEQEEEQ